MKIIVSKFAAVLTACIIYLQVSIIPVNAQEAVTPATALKTYVNSNDPSFRYEVKTVSSNSGFKTYEILLTSQTWRDIAWTHQLTVLVPEVPVKKEALLFISGGSNKNGLPNWRNNPNDELLKYMGLIATSNKVVVAVLRQTPNQPLYDGKTEDELISYTLHNYQNTKDYTWPLLFPMVKTAVRAMDVVQSLVRDSLRLTSDQFIISGFSKRGWTTWLTAAVDRRVKAIAPMVFDILNMPVSLDYQIKTWGGYSIQIQDYVNLGIPQNSSTPAGIELSTMIDPYSYRKNLSMPKMLFMGTNDEYWVIDNVKNYLDNIPGNNMLHYVPNAGHDLAGGKQALQVLNAFVAMTVDGMNYSKSKWSVSKQKQSLKVTMNTTADRLTDVIIWSASSTDKDFRNETWKSKSLGLKATSKTTIKETYPAANYKAFYIDLKYTLPDGSSYTQSSRVFLLNNKGLM